MEIDATCFKGERRQAKRAHMAGSECLLDECCCLGLSRNVTFSWVSLTESRSARDLECKVLQSSIYVWANGDVLGAWLSESSLC